MERRITRRRLLAGVGRCAVAAPFLTLAACGRGDEARRPVELRGHTMGTTYRLSLIAPAWGIDAPAVHADVGALLRRVDAELSAWRGDSDVARINAASPGRWVGASNHTMRVARAAEAARLAYAGAFDASVGALVDLWGFGPSRGPRRVPSVEAVGALHRQAGAGAIQVRVEPPAVRRMRSRVRLDLSAIAQGHAVDEAARLLLVRGIDRFLIELGGELRAHGPAAGGRPWRVAVERPTSGARARLCTVRLEGAAIATSGVYLQWFRERGRRYAHVLDPRTGRPVSHGLLSVAVIGPSAREADAAATALLVLGPAEAERVARERGLAALLAVEEEGRVRARPTPAFAAHMEREESRS